MTILTLQVVPAGLKNLYKMTFREVCLYVLLLSINASRHHGNCCIFLFIQGRAKDTLWVLYLAECSGMWEHSACFSPGFVFIALTQEAHSGGASFMLSEKRWLPSHPHLSGCSPRNTHTQHAFFFVFVGQCAFSPPPSSSESFIYSSNYNKQARTTREEATSPSHISHSGIEPLLCLSIIHSVMCFHGHFLVCEIIYMVAVWLWRAVYLSVLKADVMWWFPQESHIC